MHKLRFAIGLFSAVLVVAAACSPRAPRTVSPVPGRIFIDDLGRRVVVPVSPRRIICTSPEMTEVLFALGAGGRVVGVARGCDWPPAARRVALVGDFSNVSKEKVAALRPDLVVTTGHEQERMVAQLEGLGVPAVAFLARDFDGVRRNIEAAGDLVGERENAANLVATFDAELAAVDARVKGVSPKNRPRVYLEISPEPLMTVARGSFVHDVIERAGGINVGADLIRPYCRIDSEQVIALNPDVIVLCHDGVTPAAVRGRTGWGGIAAVRTGRIYVVNADLVLRAGPRLSRGVAALYAVFYPPTGAAVHEP